MSSARVLVEDSSRLMDRASVWVRAEKQSGWNRSRASVTLFSDAVQVAHDLREPLGKRLFVSGGDLDASLQLEPFKDEDTCSHAVAETLQPVRRRGRCTRYVCVERCSM